MKKAISGRPRGEKSPSQQIDAIIKDAGGWHGRMLAHLRATINETEVDIVEEVKWKMPSNPMGVPVWSHEGIICVANVLKNAVRLTFPRGAKMEDPKRLFNARLDSKGVRAIDFHEGDTVDEDALRELVLQAASLNAPVT